MRANVAMINTSEVRVNIVVDGAAGPVALQALKTAFADALPHPTDGMHR